MFWIISPKNTGSFFFYVYLWMLMFSIFRCIFQRQPSHGKTPVASGKSGRGSEPSKCRGGRLSGPCDCGHQPLFDLQAVKPASRLPRSQPSHMTTPVSADTSRVGLPRFCGFLGSQTVVTFCFEVSHGVLCPMNPQHRSKCPHYDSLSCHDVGSHVTPAWTIIPPLAPPEAQEDAIQAAHL